jgi:hypothetical protein
MSPEMDGFNHRILEIMENSDYRVEVSTSSRRIKTSHGLENIAFTKDIQRYGRTNGDQIVYKVILI